MTSTTLDRPSGRRALAPAIAALKLDPDGNVELVDAGAHRDTIARSVQGSDSDDVTARFTFNVPGAGVVTFWQAASAQTPCELATRLVQQFLPVPVGFNGETFDRDRQALADKPMAGVVIVTGYDRASKQNVDISDVAVERFRRALDGRDQLRARARANAPTEPLPVAAAPTVSQCVPTVTPARVDGVALLDEVMAHPRPARKRAAKKAAAAPRRQT
jgi:hypothetical protein